MTRPSVWWRAGRVVLGVLLLAGLGLAGWHGWRYARSVRVERIDLQGARHAEAEALLALAQVDTGLVMLGVDPALVADRMERHPWVASARAARLPTGTLRLAVEERVPVALALGADGRPAYYLDAAGHRMPPAPGAAYDVPLIEGLTARYHPVTPAADPVLRALLAALAGLDPATDALVATLTWRQGEVWLTTPPAGARPPVSVRLGREDFAGRLRRLRLFWDRAVLTRPEQDFALIDLRFAGQIVTQEHVRAP